MCHQVLVVWTAVALRDAAGVRKYALQVHLDMCMHKYA